MDAPLVNPPTATARDRLIDTAITLFNRHGFHATGVDRIVAVAKVAKKTLYAHFPSKEELILAALSRKRAAFADKFLPTVLATSDDPRERLLSLFELAKSWFSDPDFYGCLFINAAVEYSEASHPINACAREFKTLLRSFAREQAAAGGAADPDTLADQIALLFEGATTVAQVSARPDAATTAKGIAAQLIDQAFRR
ncbi:TetR/AcrR family transcriptional regulator [Dongia deserti]|uniref:TetR/AcrR family transcriptional regulator n=1 Tax=Dongia deserti TaxID=2268030 RepID=UPI0013C4D42D|nr:TetR/AcrR family transcriptional regulator [Dongia deserti]